MNLFYLSPSLRREFLDNILSNSYPEYSELLKNYKKIVTSRNKLLKSIFEGKSNKSDIDFWNNEFIKIAENIYSYRFPLIQYFRSHLDSSREYFNGKIEKITLEYNTKVSSNNIQQDIKEYLDKNFERDIIL
jgi:DNA replication and repair protein RecF